MLSTIAQMYEFVREGVNKGNAGTITPPEFDVLINAALMDLVEQAKVDKDQKNIDLLRVLKPPALVIANTGANAPQQEVFALPFVASPPPGTSHGYLHMLNAGCKLARLVSGVVTPVTCKDPSGWTVLRPMPTDQRYDYQRNPFWKAKNTAPYYDIKGYSVGIVAESDTFATQIRIEYLRYPVRLSAVTPVQPELPPHVNQMVCEKAVQRHLEVIESQRFATKAQERQLNA